MSDDFRQLKEHLTKLSDEELINIVLSPPGEYRKDAIEIARTELKWRKVEIPEPDEPEDEDSPASHEPTPVDVLRTRREGVSGAECTMCGGRLRLGTLVAEKELTVIFSDNQEERFVQVNACTQCGHLSLAVDFQTEVDK
jgi:hypothetical protein